MRILRFRNMIGAALMGVIAMGFAMVPANSHNMAEPMYLLDYVDVGFADIDLATVVLGDLAIDNVTAVMSTHEMHKHNQASWSTAKLVEAVSFASIQPKPDIRLRC